MGYTGSHNLRAVAFIRTKGAKTMASAYCPDCDAKITLNPNVRVGQKLTCPDCDAELEVIATDPVELDWAYDWNWEEEEEEEEEED
jgi:alpha-aminoadipate carrier protein LysW